MKHKNNSCSPLTKEFSNYFNSHYANRKQQWALCYRKYSHINTNMYVEAFHRVLKHIYMKGTINKRVDKCIHILMKYERDKAFERVVKLEKGKMTGRQSSNDTKLVKSCLGPSLVNQI